VAAYRMAGIFNFDIPSCTQNEKTTQDRPHIDKDAGTAIAFEPQASIKGHSFYLEGNFVITRTGTELLTPGMPYTADEIETIIADTSSEVDAVACC